MSLILKIIKKLLKPIYMQVKFLVFNCLDLFDKATGRKNPLVPPRSMIFIGDGNYLKTGIEFFEYFKKYGKLKSSDKVLDVGSGIGRMSVQLTNYLQGEGGYYGFDIVKNGIEWCDENITTRFDNFHFTHADIFNKMYNPKGKVKACEYIFPYRDEYFDFAFLT